MFINLKEIQSIGGEPRWVWGKSREIWNSPVAQLPGYAKITDDKVACVSSADNRFLTVYEASSMQKFEAVCSYVGE